MEALHDEVLGSWRLEWLDLSNRECESQQMTGLLEFTSGGQGKFQFGELRGGLDCQFSRSKNRSRVDFIWQTGEDVAPVSGRGWAVVSVDQMAGIVQWQKGKGSKFLAIRDAEAGSDDLADF